MLGDVGEISEICSVHRVERTRNRGFFLDRCDGRGLTEMIRELEIMIFWVRIGRVGHDLFADADDEIRNDKTDKRDVYCRMIKRTLSN